MSNDAPAKGDNPFANLNKKAFPPARKAHGQIVRWTERRSDKPAQQQPQPEPDEDTALFLNAVSSATPLNQTRTGSPDASARKPGDAFANPLPLSPSALNKRHTKTARNTPPAAPEAAAPAPSGRKDEPAPQAPDAETGSFGALLAASLNASAPAGTTAPVRPLPADQRKNTPAASQAEDATPPAATEAEDAAFASAMRDVTPLDGKSGRAIQPEVPQPQAPPSAIANPMQDFMDGRIEFSLASTDEYVEGHVIGLDLGIVGRLQAGQLSPEAHLDLHGLNAEQAFQTLVGFMRHSYMCGRRVVLVVPGRGRNSPAGIGVLREKVQEWFTQDPFRRVILAFCTARQVDGGPGSLYVLLRKFRKDRGKVIWDRNPTDPDLYI
ncbi:MAG TPA: Smr/MutS family protein [Candidatus Avidesulfovibrio excrementigallinarum]|nr:Smr/MutS family protein [Candidatus Avidesulfovibrio excrementigallinarum]